MDARKRLAWSLHRCPDGYEGPCWGPGTEDYKRADEQIAAQRQCDREDSHEQQDSANPGRV